MNNSFSSIIKQVNLIDSSQLRDEIKLRRSGELFYQGSVSLLSQAESALENALRKEIDLFDTKVDSSFDQFLTSLTQQSVSTSFFQKYLKPQTRGKYQREESTKIKSSTTAEAVNLFDLDLFESEVISLAHDEDVDAWIDLVTKCLKTDAKINTLPQIVEKTGLSVAQVFISLLFGDFELIPSGDFYEGFRIEIKSSIR